MRRPYAEHPAAQSSFVNKSETPLPFRQKQQSRTIRWTNFPGNAGESGIRAYSIKIEPIPKAAV